jgi:hypothetical protein
MIRTAIVYGIPMGLISCIPFLFMPTNFEEMDMVMGMVVGFSAMILASLFIFFAIKTYRDKKNGGFISFGKAFGVGLSILLVAGIVYSFGWEVYMAKRGDSFIEGYSRMQVKALEKKAKNDAELLEGRKKIDEEMETYRNPAARFALTFREVLPVGILACLISAAILKRKQRMVL